MEVSPWILPDGFENADVNDFEGFIYLITNTITGRAYVGKKFTKSRVKGKMTQSNWPRYFGSSKDLKADIAEIGKGFFRREIISLHETRSATNYEETAEQFRRDVLKAKSPDGTPAYYNRSIMGKFFVARETHTHSPETRAKMSAAAKGKPKSAAHRAALSRTPSPETRAKLAKAQTGKKHSQAARDKIGAAHKGRIWTDESRARRAALRRATMESRLSPEKLNAIQTIRSSEESSTTLAERFGMASKTVRNIRNRISYDWLPDGPRA